MVRPALALALAALLIPSAAGARSPSKPVSSIPAAQAGDVVVPVDTTSVVFTATALDERTALVGLERSMQRVDLEQRTTVWQVPMPNRTRVIRPLPGAPGRVLTGADDGRLRVHAVDDGRVIEALPGPPLGWIVDVAVSPDGREVAAVSIDGQLGRWRDGDRLEVRWPALRLAGGDAAPSAPPEAPRSGPFARLEGVAFAPDGRLVVAGDGGGRVSLAVFDRDAVKAVATHVGPRSAAERDHWRYGQALAFSPDGTRVALGYWGGGLELLSWPGLETRWATEMIDGWVGRIAWAGDGRLWVVDGNGLYAVRAADGASVGLRRSAPDHTLDAFDLTPSGRRAVLGPRMTGVLLAFPAKVHGDWSPPRFARPPAAPVAAPGPR